MENALYNEFIEEWKPKMANICADLEYRKNLAEHLATTEIMYHKLLGHVNLGIISNKEMDKWDIAGYSILSLQHKILNFIPDFTAKQRPQLLALSAETIKTDRFYNDVYLTRSATLSESEYLNKLKSYEYMIKEATITPDKTLKVVLVDTNPDTLAHTATFLLRDLDSHGVNLRQLIFYAAENASSFTDIEGTELFVKPL